VRVFISIDLEGISGVYSEEQTDPGDRSYVRDVDLMRADLDAALAGCVAAGADEVVVCDAHDLGSNLTYRDLPAGVSLVSGSPAPLSMMTGIDASFDAALFVGYHARAGTTAAIMDHTYTGFVFRVRLDEHLEVGELGINAGVAGSFGVPVVFVSGDDKIAREASELVSGIETAVVKMGIARTAARLFTPEEAHQRIREGVERALRSEQKPACKHFDGMPLRLVYTRTEYCDRACQCPGVTRVDARTVDIEGPDYLTVYRTFLTALDLAEGAAQA
jgi:D-amino peptidase